MEADKYVKKIFALFPHSLRVKKQLQMRCDG